jgi:hypothetical protein
LKLSIIAHVSVRQLGLLAVLIGSQMFDGVQCLRSGNTTADLHL